MALPQTPEEPWVSYLQILEGSCAGQVILLSQPQTLLGRSPECQWRADIGSVSWKHARIQRIEELDWLEDLGSTNHTFLNRAQLEQPQPLTPGDLIRLGPDLPIRYSRQARAEIELAQRMFLNATRDLLTGALNRVSLFQQLEQEVALSARHNSPFCLLLADIDHFKSVNDRYGHPAGDHVLRTLGNLFLQQSRLEDVVGRIGGEEFAFILRRTEQSGGQEFGERLRKAVESAEITLPDNTPTKLTVSLGLTTWKQGDGASQMVDRADRALYQAKHQGRNQLLIAQMES